MARTQRPIGARSTASACSMPRRNAQGSHRSAASRGSAAPCRRACMRQLAVSRAPASRRHRKFQPLRVRDGA
jgi:hypothetical protein